MQWYNYVHEHAGRDWDYDTVTVQRMYREFATRQNNGFWAEEERLEQEEDRDAERTVRNSKAWAEMGLKRKRDREPEEEQHAGGASSASSSSQAVPRVKVKPPGPPKTLYSQHHWKAGGDGQDGDRRFADLPQEEQRRLGSMDLRQIRRMVAVESGEGLVTEMPPPQNPPR